MKHVIVLAAVLALAGCTTGDAGTGSQPPTRGEEAESMDEAMVRAAVEQAAADHDLATDEITVVSADRVTWRDGSLGCPEDGMAYTQALVPGYRVVLDVAGSNAHYHAGTEGAFFHCADPQDPADGGTTDR
jgi:hypothetical protein